MFSYPKRMVMQSKIPINITTATLQKHTLSATSEELVKSLQVTLQMPLLGLQIQKSFSLGSKYAPISDCLQRSGNQSVTEIKASDEVKSC